MKVGRSINIDNIMLNILTFPSITLLLFGLSMTNYINQKLKILFVNLELAELNHH
jgi:hypothetical protein